MENIDKDLTQNLKCENEKSKMDIEDTIIKVELKSQLTQIQKPNKSFENNVEINYENQQMNKDNQNAFSIEKTDIRLASEKNRSYIHGKNLNSKENSSAMNQKSVKN